MSEWQARVENDSFLMPERAPVADDMAVRAFLSDATRAPHYAALFGGLRLSVAVLAAALDRDWRRWAFQAINVGYRTAECLRVYLRPGVCFR